MIVRILLWRLDERGPAAGELRERLSLLEPLRPPGAFLVDEAGERIGAFVASEEGEPPPQQLEELRLLVGREPDLYEEFDAID